MKLAGSHDLKAAPERVFQALMDPAILQRAIPGCERLELTAPNEYAAHLKIGIASIKGSYAGKVRLADPEPPRTFTLHLEGKGGPGFVKGVSLIRIAAHKQGASLAYSADVQVGGLIAAVGSRIMEAAAKKLAADFFVRFEKALQAAD